MTAQIATYIGVCVGAVCFVGHLVSGRLVSGNWPPFLRLLASALAGVGTISGLQLAVVLFRPPGGVPASISVDENRVTLLIAMLSIFAVSFSALHANWKEIRRGVRMSAWRGCRCVMEGNAVGSLVGNVRVDQHMRVQVRDGRECGWKVAREAVGSVATNMPGAGA
jgi:hypothetical protein